MSIDKLCDSAGFAKATLSNLKYDGYIPVLSGKVQGDRRISSRRDFSRLPYVKNRASEYLNWLQAGAMRQPAITATLLAIRILSRRDRLGFHQ